jgi:hypothetical protein
MTMTYERRTTNDHMWNDMVRMSDVTVTHLTSAVCSGWIQTVSLEEEEEEEEEEELEEEAVVEAAAEDVVVAILVRRRGGAAATEAEEEGRQHSR